MTGFRVKIGFLVTLVVATSIVSAKQNDKLNIFVTKVSSVVDKDTKRLKSIFKNIHANPELGFMEVNTAKIVANELSASGFEVTTDIGKTGVVGVLRNGKGPTFMFRADMDANAIEEETGLPYASKVKVKNLDGQDTAVAHMCGHDAHTTWLISLAKTMSQMKDYWQGTLVLVAQPAEEPIEGAKAMIDDGLYKKHDIPKPDYFLAFHTAPVPTGTVVASPGRFNTGSDHIDVTFHGTGGHGSSPHHAKDPIAMAGMAIMQFQTIVSRQIDPAETGVLTIGSVQGGVDNNVIPTEATLKLKLHYSNNDVRQQLVNSIELMSNNIANSYDVPKDMLPTVVYKGYAPAVVNSTEFIHSINQVLAQSNLTNLIIDDFQVSGSDDAAALVEGIDRVKIAYMMIGTASPKLFSEAQKAGKEFPFFVHEPTYQVDLDAIPYGGKLAALLALDTLSK